MKENHAGKRLCITGIPTAGKSSLANRLADVCGATIISTDDIRKKLGANPKFSKWVNFYNEKDPYQYYTQTSSEEQWNSLRNQSIQIWPGIVEFINGYRNDSKPVIVEGVSALPELIHRNLGWPCMILASKTLDDTHRRNQIRPRWGIKDEETLILNSKSFFEIEQPHYIKQAKEYDFPLFYDGDEAYKHAKKIIDCIYG